MSKKIITGTIDLGRINLESEDVVEETEELETQENNER